MQWDQFISSHNALTFVLDLCAVVICVRHVISLLMISDVYMQYFIVSLIAFEPHVV